MRKTYLAFAIAASLALSGCDLAPPTSPGQVAETTVLDEKAGIAAETMYTTATTLGATLARAGLIARVKFKEADNRAYNALLVVRSAYRAGNANNYAAALAELTVAVGEINALVKKG